MKILKIELQNINSLRSDTPIVIDFKSEPFKDVGLYAITGATGAGKTTVLDAITIALYHNVPRFNGTKGTLINVVSHSAYEAFSSVTFENDNTIYEAFWSIRIADKTGKPYKNPKEEVSLKNLTSKEILATQKRDLITKITHVTQLDYNQFLRSVLLAQGEFAAFLSAKGPEKGKLLEQITGEQIYKKIGQGILERKAKEEQKLKEIQAKINADDVLNDEQKAELDQKDKTLDVDFINIEKEIKTTERIVNWYTKSEALLKTAKTLEENAINIATYVEKHKTVIQLLGLHEKAAPFKELIQDFNRTEKEQLENSKDLKSLEEELKLLKPTIEGLEKQTKHETAQVALANKEFTAWLPKFDLITKLDSQLKNEEANQQKANKNLAELTKHIASLKKEEETTTKEVTETDAALKKVTTFLTEHQFLKEISQEVSNWTKELTTLKANKKSLQEDVEFINQKKVAVVKTTTLLKEDTEILNKKLNEIEKVEKEYITITEQLVKNNSKTIVAEKDKWTLIATNWKTFKGLSEQTLKVSKEQSTKSAQKKELLNDLKNLQKELETVKKQLEHQEKSVADAVKILDLEKSIAKYEDDRKNLVAGEPCGLCGSEEHPFAENAREIDVSKSELELNKRKAALKILEESKNEIEKKEVELNTAVSGLTIQINAINEELKTFATAAEKLNIACELTAVSEIDAQLKVATDQLNTLSNNLTDAQQLETRKNEVSESIKTQNEVVSRLKTTVATRNEQLKNNTTEIETRQKTSGKLTKICTDLENDLTLKLAKFKYTLPPIENTDVFIKNIENEIANYTKAEQKAASLKAKITVSNSSLINIKKQLETSDVSKKELLKAIQDRKIKTDALKAERVSILPMDTSVASKRTNLLAVTKQCTDTLELSEKELQKSLNIKTEKEALQLKTQKEEKEFVKVLSELKNNLEAQLKNSDFESKKAVESALLSQEHLLEYQRIAERIKENQLKLKTLKDENVKAIAALNTTKNFDITATASKVNLENLEKKRKEFATEKGKLLEAYRKDKEIRNRNKEIYKKIDAQEAVCGVWKELFKIIGNSKDAFNIYVQRLTLKQLLDLANVHLYKLNKRYSLKIEENYKPKEELNFNLIDHYQTDQIRLVDTSSGGEKFIISLALALGLSDLASKNVRIDSLFIDEGFGTLDKNTLETVISTLETLQSQGKTIGIISHVENLKERIATQIKITKKSNGVSTVAVL